LTPPHEGLTLDDRVAIPAVTATPGMADQNPFSGARQMSNQEAAGQPEPPDDETDRLLQACLDRLAAGDTEAKKDLITVAYERLTKRTRQMLKKFPSVQKFNDTGDVADEACMKLLKSLDAIHPDNTRRFLGLAGLQIRRVLIDLYRRYKGRESYEANRATNVFQGADGAQQHHVDGVVEAVYDPNLDEFERLHLAAEELEEADQELFHMRWFLGMTHAQIAAQFGCCEKTVKRDWSRVKEFLWQRMNGG